MQSLLIVEENSRTGPFLARTARRCGLDPTVLPSGAAAVCWAKQFTPEVILVGRPRPGTRPGEVCKGLKFDEKTCRIPLLRLGHPGLERIAGLEVEPDRWLARSASALEISQALEQARSWSPSRQGSIGEVRIRFPSHSRHLEELGNLLGSLLHSAGIAILQAQRMSMAVRELAANAIEWGHQNQIDRVVEVVCLFENDRVAVRVRDTGPGFDPNNLPHAAKPDDPLRHLEIRAARNLREGGFGIMMASGLVDELRYNACGNEAKLVMYRAARPNAPGLAASAARG
jgi:anti-sigma regulatory factor (Ser/Thr protein kinase)